tara:strand:- start:1840 stop:2391 length:552 start_codon:yes stop_codon:yes gene_type:complete
MPLLNKIPTISSGDYKNYNAYFDETPGRAAVQYFLNTKVLITDDNGVYRTILGNLSRSTPYADYTSAYVKTFINFPFRNNPLYQVNKGNIDTKTGTIINETPSGENNPTYKAQPTFMVACSGRDTLALDPSTKMLTNTRIVTQGGVTQNNNNKQQNTATMNPQTTRVPSMGSTGGSSGGGGGY